MSESLKEYFDALERLKKGRSIIIPKGSKITNDAVALEAGRGKGSIKKSRPVFSGLIGAISQVISEQASHDGKARERLVAAKTSSSKYRVLWEEALAREASLLMELYGVRKELAKLTTKLPLPENVLPIRKSSAKKSVS